MFELTSNRWLLPVLLVAGLVMIPMSMVLATVIDVEINTASLAGTDAQLAFDFVDGDFAVNNSVTVNSFITDDTLGAASSFGDVN